MQWYPRLICIVNRILYLCYFGLFCILGLGRKARENPKSRTRVEREKIGGKKGCSKTTSKEEKERNGRRKEKDGKTNRFCQDISKLAGKWVISIKVLLLDQ